jgi:galactokinase/mevalonate kinase-like predicted kinase
LLYGGKVVNVAVNLNGQPPVQVYVRKARERRIRALSIDLGVSEIFSSFADVQEYDKPGSPFALVKAALVLLGFAEESGLGTSSILSGTILGALHRFFGDSASIEQLTPEVLRIEAMMTTGGGWQDQVGGMVGGVKFVESRAGDELNFCIEYLDDFLFSDGGAAGCFTLYYTGITRLAKNILDEVVSGVKSGDPGYLALHGHLRDLAEHMRVAISRRNLPAMARLVAESWEANKHIHRSVTNEDVEDLLGATKPYYTGAKLLGAGGGGYCLFISETQEQATALRTMLSARRHDSARLVGFSLNREGLQVSVS